jgi:hypothetical protein
MAIPDIGLMRSAMKPVISPTNPNGWEPREMGYLYSDDTCSSGSKSPQASNSNIVEMSFGDNSEFKSRKTLPAIV